MITQFARMQGGPAHIHELSKGYPKYSREDTDKKILHEINDSGGPCSCDNIKKHYDCGGDCFVVRPADWEKIMFPEQKSVKDDYHLTDLGNSQRFAEQHKEKIRYAHKWNSWLVYDGKRWARDEAGRSRALAKKTVVRMYKEAGRLHDEGGRKELADHAIRSESAGKIKSML